MKRCFKCKQTKEKICFSKNNRRSDGLQVYCKACKKEQDKKYYLSNKETHYERVKNYLIVNKQKLWNYLEEHPCNDCGEKNPIVLEFDHVNGKKKGAVSFLMNYSKSSWKTILNEIEKCEVRCANCHRIKTAKQMHWYKFLAS